MKLTLAPFQETAVKDLRKKAYTSIMEYQMTGDPQVVSFTAPTGSGKTIIMTALMERIFSGDEFCPDQPDAIFVWLSDSPQLNEQSKNKIDTKSDKIKIGQCVMIQDESFDQDVFDDSHIYFLNTQKLGVNSNLTHHSDSRTYTIWETIANTARDKSDRLYFIIDEAHRGMQDYKFGEATTIMQKFLMGSREDGIDPMPVVIGMSATIERFNALVKGMSLTSRSCIIDPEDVRLSGLLKERIVITYPDESSLGKEMAVLQAAADNWKEKRDHWEQYCREQHYAYVNPVFVVQVLNGSASKISDTDLDDCLQKIEDRVGYHFSVGEVVHTFGNTKTSIMMNGLEVPYVEPSDIADDKNIKIVFFKENLSTGWDCPRAETMMSFRHAVDSTYIAQLLGRMVRTPLQHSVKVDDSLNDVHLYLPYFDSDTVNDVVKAFQSSEGGEIPTDIYGEKMGDRTYTTWSANMDFEDDDFLSVSEPYSYNEDISKVLSEESIWKDDEEEIIKPEEDIPASHSEETSRPVSTKRAVVKDKKKPELLFDSLGIIDFINKQGFTNYTVRQVQIKDYLDSLYDMVELLSRSNIYAAAINDTNNEIIQIIRDYVEDLKKQDLYDDLVEQVKRFELQVQIFDIFGEAVDSDAARSIFTSTDADVDRQFRLAENKLGNHGIANAYGREYVDWSDSNIFKIDVILFVLNPDNLTVVYKFAEARFHELNDKFRIKIANIDSEKIQREYDKIVMNSDRVTEGTFHLYEKISVSENNNGKPYKNHLYVNEKTGIAKIKLNSWEEGVLNEEMAREDFVCWLRNPSKASWALTIPYEYHNSFESAFPDILIIRKGDVTEYIIDVLEPHWPDDTDNVGKVKGLAEYARRNMKKIGRVQMIREIKDIAGRSRFVRLDVSKSAIQDKVFKINTDDELINLFNDYGE